MLSTPVFWILAAIPALVYPFLLVAYSRRFRERRELIRSALRNKPLAHYAKAFGMSENVDSAEWNRRLDFDLVSCLYPTTLCALLSLAGTVAVLSVITGSGPLAGAGVAYLVAHKAAVAAFLGAYVWGLFDFTDRFRILNLPTSALHNMWFRMVLSPVAAHFALGMLTEQLNFADAAFGFAIGMLPAGAIVEWVQDNGRKYLSMTKTPDVPPLWEHIQGLTPDIISRLIEAGVSSAAHLANQDPVRLLRRTNFEWRNVLDMMDQAVLVTYVGPPVDKLRAMGIRGAIEAGILYKRFAEEHDPNGEAHTTVAAVAKVLEMDRLVVCNLLHNLWEDAQVRVIWSLWFDLPAALPTAEEVEAPAKKAKAPAKAEKPAKEAEKPAEKVEEPAPAEERVETTRSAAQVLDIPAPQPSVDSQQPVDSPQSPVDSGLQSPVDSQQSSVDSGLQSESPQSTTEVESDAQAQPTE